MKKLLLLLACANVHAQTEMDCLAQNIYFEARNQSTFGKVAVAMVTLNRVESNKYPDTICDVVWQPKQFSWTHDGKSDKMVDERAKKHAYMIAYAAINYDYGDMTDGALHYHSTKVKPFWADDSKIVCQIEDHIFYSL